MARTSAHSTRCGANTRVCDVDTRVDASVQKPRLSGIGLLGRLYDGIVYGLIVKLTTIPGKREEMIEILKGSAHGMPGCISYVVAEDPADENVLWVTEVWDTVESHDASLTLPAVAAAIPLAKPLVANFERIAATTPVWGVPVADRP